ncbi:GAF and ANTAR domain-containing protein [Pseudonocardia sp. KRD291]|uniref:GAF and ANTAR domain-containing protein n=1 Tax=Pseudonocardia sp. KRD291 TaxID=2792007 RepID=UPI001C49EF9F|nr:GAF and ANTAR domain-containing protein [Pseudonocardia sp. KRD291]MBW0100861.1 GAF and ANTAR domain-containing protein [Pseudonocardia sp. KRD291]
MSSEADWRRDRDDWIAADAGPEQAAATDESVFSAARLPADTGPLAEQFAELAQTLLVADTVSDVLHQVVHATREITPGCDLASVTLRRPEGGFTTPVYTDALAEQIDQVQYDADEGPCVDATRAEGLGIAWCADLHGDTEHWPRFSPGAAQLGMGALLGVGMFPRGDPPRLGALNIYSTRRHGLDSTDRDIALILASHASVALSRAMDVSAAQLEATQLTEALHSRDVIGQAKGILMERRGIDAGEAFDVLRRASQDLNVKVSEIAHTLTSRRAEL